jgi:NAD(P)-dependent dehydrogenase (short-subunit alcohol dehydrogenase family)
MATKKVALVTGANKGIGLETVKQLAAQGITVLLGSRDRARGEEALTKLKGGDLDVELVLLDVDSPQTHTTTAKLIEQKYGRLDILIQNAAIAIDEKNDNGPVPASEAKLETIRKTFETNFFNVIALTQTLLPLVRKSEAGRIVFVSSLLGSLTLHSDPKSSIYHYKPLGYDLSKTALNAYAVHLAYELRDTPIKVNAAHPGAVVTDMNPGGELSVEEGAKTSVALATLTANGPTGKLIHFDEVYPW